MPDRKLSLRGGVLQLDPNVITIDEMCQSRVWKKFQF